MYTVLNYIENSASLYPDKLAIICEDEKITYKNLIKSSRSVGTFIANLKIFKKPIIIFMDKGIDTSISFLGSLYAGCSYCLVNPEFPHNRILDIKSVLNSPLVITDDDHLNLACELFENVVNISDIKNTTINIELLNIIHDKVIDYDPVYINFTSGSTGTPKGVLVGHRSVIDFIDIFTKEFNINEMINTIIERFNVLCERDGYKINYEGFDCVVSADKKKLEQVIYNLINNAINYTGENKNVYVKLSKFRGGVRVEVKDTGKGIDKEDIPYIWDKYYKVDKKYKRVTYGTGLGLSIVKNILILHDFKYGVNSEKNKGTSFYFDIHKKPKKSKM